MSIDTTTLARTRQAYQIVRILTVGKPASVLRATVTVDAYADQSSARVERFDGARWHEVVSTLGSSSHSEMPPYVSRDDAACEKAAKKVAQPLIELATRITEARGTA